MADFAFTLTTEDGKTDFDASSTAVAPAKEWLSASVATPLDSCAVCLDEDTPKISAPVLCLNLVTATLGSGILSLPWATAGASLLPGAALTIFSMALNAGTNYILVLAADRLQVFDLGALLGKLPSFGRKARLCYDLLIWLTVFLTLTGYIVVVADSLKPPLTNLPRPLLVLGGSLVSLGLCFLDPSYLAFSSGLCIAANVYLFGLLLVQFMQAGDEMILRPGESAAVSAAQIRDGEGEVGDDFGKPCVFGANFGLVTMMTALAQAAIVQMCVLPMYEQLERRTPQKFGMCLCISFGFVAVLFIAFSSVVYMMYGPQVSSNVLVNLPDSPWGHVARLGMVCAVLAVYPIIQESMVAPLKHTEARAKAKGRPFAWPSPPGSPPASPIINDAGALSYANRSENPAAPLIVTEKSTTDDKPVVIPRQGKCREVCCKLLDKVRPSSLATIVIVAGSGLGGLVFTELGTVNILNGAMQVAALLALAPGMVGLKLLGRNGIMWRAAMVTLMICGIILSVLGVFFQSNYAEALNASCKWHISEP
eukprot:TRINITY_DN31326_c0_g1_i1.p1 TRINITY_DN31326_c0_g1~~TRINITY_DN31326_c0_g1_i1.p1  ORF type:complete len:567 (+),score=97.55 TRINITY_DN31326_c0_g1_i1:92-1702(+)